MMSFFAYLALVTPTAAPCQQVRQILQDAGYNCKDVSLAAEFGAVYLYGVPVLPTQICEIELGGWVMQPDGTRLDLEASLLDPPDPTARWQHYQACAASLGRTVRDFHDDPEVDALYRRTPIDLGVVILLRTLTASIAVRPLILNLAPDFALKVGYCVVLTGMDAIRRGLWKASVFSDLEIPHCLVIP